MWRSRYSDEVIQRLLAEAAASGLPDFDKIVDNFQEVDVTDDYRLRAGQTPAEMALSANGLGKGNPAFVGQAILAARFNGLPSTRFGAVVVTYSDKDQSAMCRPVMEYDKNDMRQAKVSWSPDGKEISIDFGPILAAKKWSLGVGYVQVVDVHFINRHPKVGSVFVFCVAGGRIEESDHIKGEKNKAERKKKAAAAGNGNKGTGNGDKGTSKGNKGTTPPAPEGKAEEQKPVEQEPEEQKPEEQEPEERKFEQKPDNEAQA